MYAVNTNQLRRNFMNINSEQANHTNGVLKSIPGAVINDIPVFATVAQHYYEKKCQKLAGRNPKKQALRLQMTLEKYCLPSLGEIPMSELKTSDVVRALKPIWEEKPAVAERARLTVFNVCEMARTHGLNHEAPNPARWADNLEYFLPRYSASLLPTSAPSIDYQELPRFLRLLQKFDSNSAKALEMFVLTAARPEEVRTAKWCEFNLDEKLWKIPGWKIKDRREGQDHQIPLADRAVEILQSLPRSESDAVFPGHRGKEFLSQNALNNAIKGVHEADLKNGGPGFFDSETGRVATASGMRRAFRAFAIEEAGVSEYLVKIALSQLDKATANQSPILVQAISKRRLLMDKFAKYVSSRDNLSRK
jgi:integrase